MSPATLGTRPARLIALLLALAALAAPSPAAPQAKQTAAIFLELEGVAGESADAQHKGAIEVQSFSLSAQHSPGEGGQGGQGGKATLNDFFVLKPYDAASPHLLVACAAGRTIPKAVLTVRGGAGGGEPREYLKYTFTDVQVSRINQVVGGAAQEELNFRYASVVVEYTLPDGKVVRQGWDAKAGKPIGDEAKK